MTLPAELISAVLNHAIRDALVDDLFHPALESASWPIITNLGLVSFTFREHVDWILESLMGTENAVKWHSGSFNPRRSLPSFHRYHLVLICMRKELQEVKDSQKEHSQAQTGAAQLVFGTPPVPALPSQPGHAVAPGGTLPVSHPMGSIHPLAVSVPTIGQPIPAHEHAYTAQDANPDYEHLPILITARHFAQATLFRDSFLGDGVTGRIDQSCVVDSLQGGRALGAMREAKRVAKAIRPTEVSDTVLMLLTGLEAEIRQGLEVCQWKDTLEKLCLSPVAHTQQTHMEAFQCFLEMEAKLNTISVPLLTQTELITTIRRVSRLETLVPTTIQGHSMDWRQRAFQLSIGLTNRVLFWSPFL